MRIQHKMNHGWAPSGNDPEWDRRVEREADATTNATERAFLRAQKRLARAQARLTVAAERQSTTPARLAVLEAIVEHRRQELLAMERLMTNHGSPSTSSGTKSHRGVPGTRAL
jgi:hypothetical protein